MSLLLDVLKDISSFLSQKLGNTGIIIIVAMLSIIALFLLANIIKAAGKLSKPKVVFKWGQFILMVICIAIVVWLCVAVL